MSNNNHKLTTLLDHDNEIKYVYHLSDIHIRNTERYIEYKEVFEKTYNKLKEQINENNKDSLIVLTGDITHSKTIMSPELIDRIYDFFDTLSKIAPVILIIGNHDCNLTNKDRLDALTPIIQKVGNFKNFHYLKYSGIYRYNNIIFGVSSLLDDDFIYAYEINEKMLNTINNDNKYKIALYHGMLKGTKMDNGFVTKNNDLTKKYFIGYDYVMLGDLHTHQIINAKKTMAYAGSLIQQTHGESLRGHGFLKWDLLKCEIKLYEIENDYGFCRIYIKNGKMIDTDIPKNPTIKFILENTTELEYQKIYTKLNKKYNIFDPTKEFINEYDPTSYQEYDNSLNIYDDQIKNSKINSFLKLKKFNKQDRMSIIKLHNKIEKIIINDDKYNIINNKQWKILELRFSNMLSFGENNIIDFTKYNSNQIISICAPNHYGKSSILDIILFCVFDKYTRGDRSDILNKNKKNMYCSLLLEIGSQKYLIERKGNRSSSEQSVKIDVQFYKIKYDKNSNQIKESMTGLHKNNTNEIIAELLGNYKDYLNTCICIQQSENNFMNMSKLKKKEYLYEILKLNVFDKCYSYAKEKLQLYTIQSNTLETELQSKEFENIKQNIKKLNKIKTKLNEQLLSLQQTGIIKFINLFNSKT